MSESMKFVSVVEIRMRSLASEWGLLYRVVGDEESKQSRASSERSRTEFFIVAAY